MIPTTHSGVIKMEEIMKAVAQYLEEHPREDGDRVLALQICLNDIEAGLRDDWGDLAPNPGCDSMR